MRERLLFCLLFISIMLYYAIPLLRFTGSVEEVVFSVSWLMFALLSIGGNIAAVLHVPGKNVGKRKEMYNKRKRMHNY